MQNLVVLLFAALMAPTFTVLAQNKSSYDGTWKVVATPPNGGGVYESEVVIDGEGGSWQAHTHDGENPCVGRKFPLHVLTSTAEGLSVQIAASESLAGCPNGKFTAKRIDDNTLKGKRGQTDLVFTRR